MSAPDPARLEFWLAVLDGQRRGLRFEALRALLAAMSALYVCGLDLYLAAERLGLRRRDALPVPVISVGNLVSGGAGKTPMTQYIASALADEGRSPVILSRGYGGSLSHAGVQVSDGLGGVLSTAAEAGDEAVQLARALPSVPVFVGKDRRKSAASALACCAPGVIVLDDGLQYWQLARDLDVVLLDSRRPFDNGRVLPRGALREPKEHLRRAGIVVLTRSDLADERMLRELRRTCGALAPTAAVFEARHAFAGMRRLSGHDSPPARMLAVCGIAQPESFATVLRGGAAPLAGEVVALPDHVVYDAATVEKIKGKMRDWHADALVTTAKDAAKLPLHDFEHPIYVAEVRMEIDRPDEFWVELKRRANLPGVVSSAWR